MWLSISTTIQNAHDNQEITCCRLDSSDRHLFTGANNGTLKAWNVLDGTVLQIFQSLDDKEVTSLVIIEQKKLLLAVGWNKKITIYNIEFDVWKIIRDITLKFRKTFNH